MKNRILNRRTARLVIRPLEEKDYLAWKESHLAMKPSQNKWDFGPRSKDAIGKLDFKKILRGQKERRKKDWYYDLAVFDKKGLLVGTVSLMEISRSISQTAYVGYRIFNNYWNKGYGKEAVQAMINIGFDDIKLHRIEAGIEPKNSRSIRLAKSLGMRREGIKKRALFFNETWVDIVMFTLTCEDVGKKYDFKNLKILKRS